MPKLTYKEKKHLRKTQFAVPEKRKYPIEDISHARNALARVELYGSPMEKHEVREAVHNRYPSIGCSHCGSTSTHQHGIHGCCGKNECHFDLVFKHMGGQLKG